MTLDAILESLKDIRKDLSGVCSNLDSIEDRVRLLETGLKDSRHLFFGVAKLIRDFTDEEDDLLGAVLREHHDIMMCDIYKGWNTFLSCFDPDDVWNKNVGHAYPDSKWYLCQGIDSECSERLADLLNVEDVAEVLIHLYMDGIDVRIGRVKDLLSDD